MLDFLKLADTYSEKDLESAILAQRLIAASETLIEAELPSDTAAVTLAGRYFQQTDRQRGRSGGRQGDSSRAAAD